MLDICQIILYLTPNLRSEGLRLLSYVVVTILFFCSIAVADIIKAGSFKASSDGTNVILEWTTEDETSVARFEIERRSGTDGNFETIATVNTKGLSSYQFVDYSVFKKSDTIYQYRLKIMFIDNSSPLYDGPIAVSHTVSGVRRTWGSIKAMFR